jgi:hypothetical protein
MEDAPMFMSSLMEFFAGRIKVGTIAVNDPSYSQDASLDRQLDTTGYTRQDHCAYFLSQLLVLGIRCDIDDIVAQDTVLTKKSFKLL